MPYAVKLCRIGPMALFDLKGPATAIRDWAPDLPPLPRAPNTSTSTAPEILFIGRNHWLLRAPLAEETTLDRLLRPAQAPAEISLLCLSDSLCFFSITGRDADQILSIASSLDVHPSVFPPNGACFSEAFGLKALISRLDDGFLIGVEQSYGDLIADYLGKATGAPASQLPRA